MLLMLVVKDADVSAASQWLRLVTPPAPLVLLSKM
jgi:hypothetical protein